ncbi:MAG: hypothetical protein HOP19_29310 [Acidobacteria bacterium]|nr:hypothetical protein [Acidobacteriota bacterium]
MLEQVYEGTWEDLAAHADEFEGKHLRLTVVEDTPRQNYQMLEVMRRIAERDKDRPLTSPEPNYAMLEVLRQTEELQQGMRFTDGSDTQRLLREARAGGMYGDEPTEAK